MSDDVKTLVEPAQEWDARAVQRNPEKAARYIQALAAALEAATSAPAVDREALVNFLRQDENYVHDPDADGWVFSAEMAVVGLLASGILRDVGDVQAEALEQAERELPLFETQRWPEHASVRRWLTARAQAIREARSER